MAMTKESFPSVPTPAETPEARARRERREYKARYEALPAAKPRMFAVQEADGEVRESPFAFPPVEMSVAKETVEELIKNYEPTDEKSGDLRLKRRLDDLRTEMAKGDIFGEYEVSYIMRAPGDMNRIDKMIAELDVDNPWQAGRVEHLFLLAQTNPELFADPVVALGSETKRGDIPCLQSSDDGRIGYANHPRAGSFNKNYCFLVVRRK